MQSIITFLKGDRHGSETDYRDNLPVNMLPVYRPMHGADGYMIQAPGLTLLGSGSGVDRGGIWNERFKAHFRVSGTNFISVDAAGVVTVLGTVPGDDLVKLPYSFNTQGVIADGRFFLYDPTNGFREVTDSDLGAPIDGVWVDGYYFFTDGEFIYHTDISSESVIDPLKFATAEFMPDDSVAVGKTSDNKVLVFGRYTIEYFVNVATDNFAFQRVSNRAAKCGIVGPNAKGELNGRWYMLGGRKEAGIGVHVLEIGDPKQVSTREIDKIIGSYTENELYTAKIEVRSEDAYSYVIVHLPNETLVFNETIAGRVGIDNAWTVLKSDVLGSSPWRGINGVFEPRIGKFVYGDKLGSNIGVLDETVATEYGEITEWLLYSPIMNIESNSIDEIELETIPGFTVYDDATVFISMNYDGVFTGGEWTRLYGEKMNYGRRFILRRLGYVKDSVSIRLRGASRSRMAFHRAKMIYG